MALYFLALQGWLTLLVLACSTFGRFSRFRLWWRVKFDFDLASVERGYR